MSARAVAAAAAVPCCVFAAACAAAPDAAGLRAFVAAAPHTVAVAWRDLDTGAAVELDADLVLHAASTMKVPVLIELFRRRDAGLLGLDDEVLLQNAFASIVDGSAYALDARGDSDPGLYVRVGAAVTLGELAERMIVSSSNLATNVLIARLGAPAVQATCERLGTSRTRVLRGVEDGPAFARGLNNVTTAHDLALLMAAIARGTAVSPASCRDMLAILRRQRHRDLIPAGLPPGTPVANKTGWITRIQHDAAIVLDGERPAYVLVVLTAGYDDPAASAGVIAEVARRVHAMHARSAR